MMINVIVILNYKKEHRMANTDVVDEKLTKLLQGMMYVKTSHKIMEFKEKSLQNFIV